MLYCFMLYALYRTTFTSPLNIYVNFTPLPRRGLRCYLSDFNPTKYRQIFRVPKFLKSQNFLCYCFVRLLFKLELESIEMKWFNCDCVYSQREADRQNAAALETALKNTRPTYRLYPGYTLKGIPKATVTWAKRFIGL